MESAAKVNSQAHIGYASRGELIRTSQALEASNKTEEKAYYASRSRG